MRGKGITSGRRRYRPDGAYYRETRRRSLSDSGRTGRRLRAGLNVAALAVAMIALVAVAVWMLR